MDKIWEQDDFWDKAHNSGNFGRYASPFRILDSNGKMLLAKSKVHHLKAAFDEYIFDNQNNLEYPYIAVDTACHHLMVIEKETGLKEWREFFDWCEFAHDH